MVLKMTGARMFHLGEVEAIQTWNPVVGCLYHCYADGCWAAKVCGALMRDANAKIKAKYSQGFYVPKFFPEVLDKAKFSPGKTYFVVSMGDLFGSWVSDEWIHRVLETVRKWPRSRFFFETKNPVRYQDFIGEFPKTAILSTTIETNRSTRTSAAPPAWERWKVMRDLYWPCKHISVEPIVDFDLEELLTMLTAVRPWMVAVGYDSLANGLPEPSLEKTMQLIAELEKAGIKVERKLLREKIAMKGSWM